MYAHCGDHCIKLVIDSIALSSPHIRDPVRWVHELGTLTSQSKFNSMFAVNAAAMKSDNSLPECMYGYQHNTVVHDREFVNFKDT